MYAVTLSRVPRWSQHEGLASMGASFPASPQHHISKSSHEIDLHTVDGYKFHPFKTLS